MARNRDAGKADRRIAGNVSGWINSRASTEIVSTAVSLNIAHSHPLEDSDMRPLRHATPEELHELLIIRLNLPERTRERLSRLRYRLGR
jgi:hypothetical protein